MASSMRPTSMVERARLAKVPPPETALKCPRCDSTNTKFCYFNNYSLLQPRHFCKTCRRYWTQGGALRNVPVGGGYRRNKRRSKSGSGGSAAKSSTTPSTTMTSVSSGAIPSNTPPAPPLLPLRALMHHLPEYGASNKGLGLGFNGIQSIDTVDQYQFGSTSGIGLDQWRLQQLPLFGGPESSVQMAPPAPGLFPFDECQYYSGQLHAKASTSGHITQLASVKMEDLKSTQGLDLQQEYNSGWPADLSDFNLPPSGNLL